MFTQSFTPNCPEGQNNRASPMQVKHLFMNTHSIREDSVFVVS